MKSLSRKQLEIQERELLLLQYARTQLVELGYAQLNMDRLAELTNCSKGTVYQHFSSKEDLVTALAIQSLEKRNELFERASTFAGSTRERILALAVADEIFAQVHEHYFRSELVIRMANLDERASPARWARFQELEQNLLKFAFDIIQDAQHRDELPMPEGRSPESVLFVLFSIVIGTHLSISNYCSIVEKLGVNKADQVFLNNANILLDGLQWRPLTLERDYDVTIQRIKNEVFANEYASL